MSWEGRDWDEEPEFFGTKLAPEAAEAVDAAVEAALEADAGEGQLDDLVLLGALLDAGDDGVVTVLGSRCRSIVAAVDAARADQPAAIRALPFADDVLTVAEGEAFATTGSATVAPVHLLLALFAFPGTASEAALHGCGVDWRPLRSIARRLLRHTYDF